MEEIIKKAIDGGYTAGSFNNDGGRYEVLDPLFWRALFKNKREEWETRQRFFSILFGDNGEIEGWEKAVEYLKDITK